MAETSSIVTGINSDAVVTHLTVVPNLGPSCIVCGENEPIYIDGTRVVCKRCYEDPRETYKHDVTAVFDHFFELFESAPKILRLIDFVDDKDMLQCRLRDPHAISPMHFGPGIDLNHLSVVAKKELPWSLPKKKWSDLSPFFNRNKLSHCSRRKKSNELSHKKNCAWCASMRHLRQHGCTPFPASARICNIKVVKDVFDFFLRIACCRFEVHYVDDDDTMKQLFSFSTWEPYKNRIVRRVRFDLNIKGVPMYEADVSDGWIHRARPMNASSSLKDNLRRVYATHGWSVAKKLLMLCGPTRHADAIVHIIREDIAMYKDSDANVRFKILQTFEDFFDIACKHRANPIGFLSLHAQLKFMRSRIKSSMGSETTDMKPCEGMAVEVHGMCCVITKKKDGNSVRVFYPSRNATEEVSMRDVCHTWWPMATYQAMVNFFHGMDYTIGYLVNPIKRQPELNMESTWTCRDPKTVIHHIERALCMSEESIRGQVRFPYRRELTDVPYTNTVDFVRQRGAIRISGHVRRKFGDALRTYEIFLSKSPLKAMAPNFFDHFIHTISRDQLKYLCTHTTTTFQPDVFHYLQHPLASDDETIRQAYLRDAVLSAADPSRKIVHQLIIRHAHPQTSFEDTSSRSTSFEHVDLTKTILLYVHLSSGALVDVGMGIVDDLRLESKELNKLRIEIQHFRMLRRVLRMHVEHMEIASILSRYFDGITFAMGQSIDAYTSIVLRSMGNLAMDPTGWSSSPFGRLHTLFKKHLFDVHMKVRMERSTREHRLDRDVDALSALTTNLHHRIFLIMSLFAEDPLKILYCILNASSYRDTIHFECPFEDMYDMSDPAIKKSLCEQMRLIGHGVERLRPFNDLPYTLEDIVHERPRVERSFRSLNVKRRSSSVSSIGSVGLS